MNKIATPSPRLGGSIRVVRALVAAGRTIPTPRRRVLSTRRVPSATLSWTLVWLVDVAGRRGPPLAA